MKHLWNISLLICFSYSFLQAQSSIEIQVLTNQILVVHYDEGYIEYHKRGESDRNDKVFIEPLDITAATQITNYQLSSATDTNYKTPQSPEKIGRKSKGTEFANYCEGWQFQEFFGVVGCDNTSPDHTKEHWLYLFLPEPLVSGQKYQLTVDASISPKQQGFDFVYNERALKSQAIHVNNLGYSTAAELKIGYVYHWLGDQGGLELNTYGGNAFYLLDLSSNTIAYEGDLQFRKTKFTIETFQDAVFSTPNQNFSASDVYECDFSDFNTPGRYRLFIEDIGASNDFEIACNVFRPAYEACMKNLYENRSGIALEAPYSNRPRPAPHNPMITPGFGDKLKFSSTTFCEVEEEDASENDKALWEAGIKGDLTETWGWYQDAGDWDAYHNHMKVPAMLMFLYEHFPNTVNVNLNIPESSNDLPDVLDEARWLIRFYKRLKDETESKNWTSGGVPGSRIFPDLWGDDSGENRIARGSWEDNDRWWVVSGEDPVQTYAYAASAAQFAFLLQKFDFDDPENIDWQQEAINAFAWAEQNYNPDYACHDHNIRWKRNYAVAALYRLTEQESYQDLFIESWKSVPLEFWENLQDSEAFGAYIYAATQSEKINSDLQAEVLAKLEQTADFFLLDNIENRACRWGGNIYLPMLIGQPTTPLVFEGLMGYVLLREENPNKAADYWKYIHTTADYFLGTNPLNMTWISGLNEHSPTNVFHLDARYDDSDEPIVGVIPYGPWRRQPWFNVIGPWDNHWSEKTVYPAIDEWPGHERWFSQRNVPLASEFTIHQNTIAGAVIYGALSGLSDCQETVSNVEQVKEIQEDEITVFPNPSSGVVEILVNDGNLIEHVEVFDLNGKLLLQIKTDNNQLDLNEFSDGVYILKIETNNDVFVEKVVLARE